MKEMKEVKEVKKVKEVKDEQEKRRTWLHLRHRRQHGQHVLVSSVGGLELVDDLVEGHVGAAGPVGGEGVEGLVGDGGGVLLLQELLPAQPALHGVMSQQGRGGQLAFTLWGDGRQDWQNEIFPELGSFSLLVSVIHC